MRNIKIQRISIGESLGELKNSRLQEMANVLWLLSAIIVANTLIAGTWADEDFKSTIKLLQEQVSALLDHRQEDYNALEESLKRSMEKNTELIVLKNEVKQLR